MAALPLEVYNELERRYDGKVKTKQDRREYRFIDFCFDLIHEVGYRFCCTQDGFEIDGNWIEFEHQWKLKGTKVYEEVLKAMIACGFTTETEVFGERKAS